MEEPASDEPNPQERLEIQEEGWSNENAQELVGELFDDLRKRELADDLRDDETTQDGNNGVENGEDAEKTAENKTKKTRVAVAEKPASETHTLKNEPVGAARLGRDARKFSGKRGKYETHGQYRRKRRLPKSLKERRRTRAETQKAAERFQKDSEK